MKNIRFTASESVEIPVEEQYVPIEHYLRQPERLVKAIADPNLTEQLSQERFRVKMRPKSFLMYRFQPAVVLKVSPGSDGTIHLNSQDCAILGNEYINKRFGLDVIGKLSATPVEGTTHLKGRADVEVRVELPPALWFTPQSLLEKTGNSLVKMVLGRIKQQLLNQLIADYYQWANSDTSQETTSHTTAS
ncbi:MAG: hypothetical protein BRC40_01125 [Cyanobacteria bacterium QH_8_48_120]|jgi:hypothetical protein|nr:MAG: hypothetical protein BRC34_00185 [Cyanobacteria bacterium QH_1_48_107]PSO69055.1 MAG: hypothetical protein BRC38_00475 [Cyanobacteria bacterium QH_6_48_35]PSO77853.1 MAG: hypothetical protein BRC40_01125 [Cyanobacteria bacterium QH_8_48_120]